LSVFLNPLPSEVPYPRLAFFSFSGYICNGISMS
jgi:hypothetical protein